VGRQCRRATLERPDPGRGIAGVAVLGRARPRPGTRPALPTVPVFLSVVSERHSINIFTIETGIHP